MDRGRLSRPKRVHTLKARALRRIIKLANGDQSGLSIVQQVTNGLSLLGVDLLQDDSTGCITLRKARRREEQWWDMLDVNDIEGIMIEELPIMNTWEKFIVCRTLSGLREALARVRDAKLGTRLKREQVATIEKLSAWGMASAIVLQYAVSRKIFVYGKHRKNVTWCCEWMMGEVDKKIRRAECFTVDLPLKLLKGGAINVLGNGVIAVRIDGNKALKLMKVASHSRNDLNVDVLRAGGGRKALERSNRENSRNWQWRPFTAVIAVTRQKPFVGYWKSGNVIYLD